VGIKHSDGNADANWSAGIGYGVRLFSVLRLAVEGRYRVEDQDIAGFWQLRPDDRRGFELQAGLRIATGRSPRASRPAAYREEDPPAAAPNSDEIREAAGRSGLSEESAAIASNVVETALAAMGTPYRWGGSGENGFDCSGLIQYAYGEHGVILPRVSRDQARTGISVNKAIGALAPGDILTFSVEGNGVSHVALYVGDGMFIHSSSQGVRLSSLMADDGDSRWWRARWVGVRRILN
jgi:cell wall-associated NlpC family hydrolase